MLLVKVVTLSNAESIYTLQYKISTFHQLCWMQQCIRHYSIQDRHHVILSSHAGCMAIDLISIVSMHSCTPYTCTTRWHIHTCYTPAVALSGTSWASWCVHFPPLLSAGERCIAAERAFVLFETGGFGPNFCWERRRVSEGGRNTLDLVRQNIVQALHINAVAAKQMIECWKSLMVVCIRCMQSMPL